MRLRNIPYARAAVAQNPLVFESPKGMGDEWDSIFGRHSQKAIEIGMGKGRFIIETALKYPAIDFFGLERYESVMIRALQSLDRMEEVPPNLRFIRGDARDIESFFLPESLDAIYLNFSDPWPKKRHEKRRLVSKEYLLRFKNLLCHGGKIEFKTDNSDLFSFGLSEIDETGFELTYQTRDLHSDPIAMQDNIMTEYEERFSSLGNKINKFIIVKT